MDNKSKNITFRCSSELRSKLEKLADEQGRTLSNLIVNILKEATK